MRKCIKIFMTKNKQKKRAMYFTWVLKDILRNNQLLIANFNTKMNQATLFPPRRPPIIGGTRGSLLWNSAVVELYFFFRFWFCISLVIPDWCAITTRDLTVIISKSIKKATIIILVANRLCTRKESHMALASRFFRLLSGHSIARSFLNDKLNGSGWCEAESSFQGLSTLEEGE